MRSAMADLDPGHGVLPSIRQMAGIRASERAARRVEVQLA